MGLMIGAMVGITTAVGLHTLLSARPGLVSTWLGSLLVFISAPGVRLIGLVSSHATSHELGMLSHWLSLQITIVLGAAVIGALVGFAAQRVRTSPPPGASRG